MGSWMRNESVLNFEKEALRIVLDGAESERGETPYERCVLARIEHRSPSIQDHAGDVEVPNVIGEPVIVQCGLQVCESTRAEPVADRFDTG
jgi:hypothetical protein